MVGPDKVKFIKELLPSMKPSKVKYLVGHMGYYKKYVKGYAKITYPMGQLLKKETPFECFRRKNHECCNIGKILTQPREK